MVDGAEFWINCQWPTIFSVVFGADNSFKIQCHLPSCGVNVTSEFTFFSTIHVGTIDFYFENWAGISKYSNLRSFYLQCSSLYLFPYRIWKLYCHVEFWLSFCDRMEKENMQWNLFTLLYWTSKPSPRNQSVLPRLYNPGHGGPWLQQQSSGYHSCKKSIWFDLI